MKKTVVACLMLLGGISMMFAQSDNRAEIRQTRMQEMQAQKIAFIKEKVSFTDKESADFFPLYQEFEQKRMELTRKSRPQGKGFRAKNTEMTEQEKEAIMDNFIQNRVETANLEKSYYEKFKKILPASKLFEVYQADREFKQELLQDYRDKAPQDRGESPRENRPARK
jgi:hypothetical protein